MTTPWSDGAGPGAAKREAMRNTGIDDVQHLNDVLRAVEVALCSEANVITLERKRAWVARSARLYTAVDVLRELREAELLELPDHGPETPAAPPMPAPMRPEVRGPVNPFDDPRVLGPTPRVDLGPRLKWAALNEPDGESAGHRSASQVSSFTACSARFLLERRRADVIQRPAWWFVGGSALHAAIEAHEHGNQQVTFETELDREIERVSISSICPPDEWAAGGRGKENESWWRVVGEEMLSGYLAGDKVERGVIAPWLGALAVEAPFVLDVDGVDVHGFIDQVRLVGADAAVTVDDIKSGSRVTLADTLQLGVYAHAVARELGVEFVGARYWAARKGEYLAVPGNLLERHPWEEIVHRVYSMDKAERAGIFTPNPTSFCGACTVRHACPTGGA